MFYKNIMNPIYVLINILSLLFVMHVNVAQAFLHVNSSQITTHLRHRNLQRRCYMNKDDKNSLERSMQVINSNTNLESDSIVLIHQAQKLRHEASILQSQLDKQKEERLQKQYAKVDALIDSLLFHGIQSNNRTNDNQELSKVQLMQTEEQVAELLISKRLDYDMVNLMFDRIVQLSNMPQSIDSCSPLLSLLLDAVDKVDCLEREENPNKRWNRTVEKDLRRKLFALGFGIHMDDVNREKRGSRSITGDRDLY